MDLVSPPTCRENTPSVGIAVLCSGGNGWRTVGILGETGMTGGSCWWGLVPPVTPSKERGDGKMGSGLVGSKMPQI